LKEKESSNKKITINLRRKQQNLEASEKESQTIKTKVLSSNNQKKIFILELDKVMMHIMKLFNILNIRNALKG